MSHADLPIERSVFDSHDLMAAHPPVWRDRNKRVVYGIACPPGSEHHGQLVYTRWRAMPLPARIAAAELVQRAERRDNVFDYAPVLGAVGAVEWHVNFADAHLFVAYGSRLFAQDEMQVAEHPALGALKEALTANGSRAMTEENGRPTPILISGAERRCRVATNRDSAEGRPDGLYGNTFAAASEESVRRATSRIDPPTITNLIAIAAPSGGFGPYSTSEIEHTLTTAYTGFRAAVLESVNAPTVVHTGFWGCGAFGGNRKLMAMLQVIAAGMAGVDRLIFHSFNTGAAFDSAVELIKKTLPEPSVESGEVVKRVEALSLEWGVSDGN